MEFGLQTPGRGMERGMEREMSLWAWFRVMANAHYWYLLSLEVYIFEGWTGLCWNPHISYDPSAVAVWFSPIRLPSMLSHLPQSISPQCPSEEMHSPYSQISFWKGCGEDRNHINTGRATCRGAGGKSAMADPIGQPFIANPWPLNSHCAQWDGSVAGSQVAQVGMEPLTWAMLSCPC